MSALEEIQQAIDKLTELKAESTPGPWERIDDQFYSKIVNPQIDVFTDIAHVGITPVDAELIVNLHRTIEPLLAILREARDYADDWHNAAATQRGHAPTSIYRKELALARAINGGA